MDYDDVFYDPPQSIGEDAGDLSMDLENSLGLVISDLAANTINDDAIDAENKEDRQESDSFQQDDASARVSEENDDDRKINEQNGNTDSERLLGFGPRSNIEVAIPEMPLEKRSEYVEVHSRIVEFVNAELPTKRGNSTYHIEFTDGREELVSESFRLQTSQ